MSNTTWFRTAEELAIGFWIWATVTPTLIVLGTAGNVITLFVLNRKKMSKHVSTTRFMSLAITDLVVLYALALPTLVQQIDAKFGFDKSNIGCKISYFAIHFAPDLSAWNLVAITIERVIATKWPFIYKRVCTRRSAWLSLAAIAVSAFIVNGHLMVGYGFVPVGLANGTLERSCVLSLDGGYEDFMKVWPTIVMIKTSVLPIAFMLCGNVFIIIALCRRRKDSAVQTPARPDGRGGNSRTTMTFILLGVNFLFIGTTVPIAVYVIANPFFYTLNLPNAVKFRDPSLAVLLQLTYLNHVLNFLLYCFTGSVFRSEMKDMLTVWKNKCFCS